MWATGRSAIIEQTTNERTRPMDELTPEQEAAIRRIIREELAALGQRMTVRRSRGERAAAAAERAASAIQGEQAAADAQQSLLDQIT